MSGVDAIEQGEVIRQNREDEAASYNRRLIKGYLTKSPVTMGALAVVWMVFFIEVGWTMWLKGVNFDALLKVDVDVMHDMGYNRPDLVQGGAYYRLVTATILHAGLFHIAANTLGLLNLCAGVEANSLAWLFPSLYLIGGIQGNMLHNAYYLNFGNPYTPGVGASTSICAIMGLYFAQLLLQAKKNGSIAAAGRPIITMTIYLLVISLLPGISLLGHFGGLIGGVLLGMGWTAWEDLELRLFKWTGSILFTLYSLFLIYVAL